VKLETDTRVRARRYLDGEDDEQPQPYARQLIGWLLEDLAAANGEVRHLQRERAELRARVGGDDDDGTV